MSACKFVLPAMLLAIGCTGRAKDADTTTIAVDTSDAVTLADTTIARDSALAMARARSSAGAGGLRSGSSARRPPAGNAGGRAATARGRTDSVPPAGEQNDSSMPRSAGTDSVRGIVSVVGTAQESRVVLRPSRGGRSVTLIGPEARTVGRLSGADVLAIGTRDEHGQLRVSRFTVRTVDGNVAFDGTLIARGARLLVVTRDGEQHLIENPPAALKDHVGARVWITGAAGKGPVVYGVIEERR